ncbi:hypothetical protein EVAR_80077_1 [Eumeta japonica]|uniref:Uncharacterized protein n=1 Tax=Eumeta variegata TaxID=151549 RepID=A0A4C1UE65_EUMVA|nr:hypothetical protein EVAR_80077_1 [Eumeta japonica]
MPEWKGRVPLTRSHCERITKNIPENVKQTVFAVCLGKKTARTGRGTGPDLVFRAFGGGVAYDRRPSTLRDAATGGRALSWRSWEKSPFAVTVQRTKLCRSELPANDAMRRFNAPRTFPLLPRVLTLRYSDAFAANCTAVGFQRCAANV